MMEKNSQESRTTVQVYDTANQMEHTPQKKSQHIDAVGVMHKDLPSNNDRSSTHVDDHGGNVTSDAIPLRRSTRKKITPVHYWDNERVVYDTDGSLLGINKGTPIDDVLQTLRSVSNSKANIGSKAVNPTTSQVSSKAQDASTTKRSGSVLSKENVLSPRSKTKTLLSAPYHSKDISLSNNGVDNGTPINDMLQSSRSVSKIKANIGSKAGGSVLSQENVLSPRSRTKRLLSPAYHSKDTSPSKNGVTDCMLSDEVVPTSLRDKNHPSPAKQNAMNYSAPLATYSKQRIHKDKAQREQQQMQSPLTSAWKCQRNNKKKNKTTRQNVAKSKGSKREGHKISIWSGNGIKRGVRDVNEFDVLLNCIGETAVEYRDSIQQRAVRQTIEDFFQNVQGELTNLVSMVHEHRTLQKQVAEKERHVEAHRKKARDTRHENAILAYEVSMLEEEVLEQQSSGAG